MSLKELTADKHKAAESTKFMQSVFDGTITQDTWADWTLQKTLIYSAIEDRALKAGLLDDMPDLERTHKLLTDYSVMTGDKVPHDFKYSTVMYQQYILALPADKILAHLYTWHMGDLFGGQMIKRVVKAPHSSLEFIDAPGLISTIRTKLSDDMAPEVRTAFDWAIKILESYE
jgi:heme oxygenase